MQQSHKVLDIVDFVLDDYDKDLWPTCNVDNIKAILSQNLYDNQIFISDEGVLLKFTI